MTETSPTYPAERPTAPSGAPTLVSVILPTCRRDHLLRGALRSAVAQTYKNIEIIVSDNAASDATSALVASFGDRRVRYRRNVPAIGVFANHLVALQEAKGEYAAFLHDDDIWEETFLERLVFGLETNPHCVLAFCDQTIINGRGIPSQSASDAASRWWKRDTLREGVYRPFWELVVRQSIPMCAGTVFRRTALHPDEAAVEAGAAGDVWFTYLMCRTGLGAYYVPERLVRYRYHDAQQTSQPTDLRLGTIWLWETLSREPGFAPYGADLCQRLAEAHLTTAALALRRGECATARYHALLAMQKSPSFHGALLVAAASLPPFGVRAALRARTFVSRRRGGGEVGLVQH